MHAYWDISATVTDQRHAKTTDWQRVGQTGFSEVSRGGGRLHTGDTWDLYVGKDNRVQQFIYHRGGPKPPRLVTASWTGYKKAGPLLFSTEHRGTADGKPLHIFLTGVSVKLTGSDKWINAQ